MYGGEGGCGGGGGGIEDGRRGWGEGVDWSRRNL